MPGGLCRGPACSFHAAHAYELPADDLWGILRGIGKRLARSPLEFVRWPRAGG